MARPSYIYIFATAGPGGLSAPCKVGVSQDPKERLKQCLTHAPRPVEIYACFEAPNREIATALEGAFHTVKAEQQLHREWFSLAPEECRKAMIGNLLACLEAYGMGSHEAKCTLGMSMQQGREAIR
jgi:hypothetical protein